MLGLALNIVHSKRNHFFTTYNTNFCVKIWHKICVEHINKNFNTREYFFYFNTNFHVKFWYKICFEIRSGICVKIWSKICAKNTNIIIHVEHSREIEKYCVRFSIEFR